MMDLTTLKRADGIMLRVGTRGTQYALVVSVAPDGKTARVRKWLARGRRWTNRITVYPAEVLGRAVMGQYPHPTHAWPEKPLK